MKKAAEIEKEFALRLSFSPRISLWAGEEVRNKLSSLGEAFVWKHSHGNNWLASKRVSFCKRLKLNEARFLGLQALDKCRDGYPKLPVRCTPGCESPSLASGCGVSYTAGGLPQVN
jgi:hypothetical protein